MAQPMYYMPAHSPATQEAELHTARPRATSFPRGRKAIASKPSHLSREDADMMTVLQDVKNDLAYLHNCLDNTTDELLVDALIYELKATHLRYQYYLAQCKQRGIVSGEVPVAQLARPIIPTPEEH